MFGKKRKYVVTEEMDGMRIDHALSILEPKVSRQYIQKLIKSGNVFIEKKFVKPSFRVVEGFVITVDYPRPVKMDLEPVELPLKIVYEDKYILVVDKEAGVVVHPAEKGKFMGQSLVNAALFHVGIGLKGIGGVMRPGIVHRLDKDTSGLIIIAKTDIAHQNLVEQFKSRQVEKYYKALVKGVMPIEHGYITDPIGRDSRNRKLMAVQGIAAKEAKTEFWVLKRFKHLQNRFELLNIRLHTGRTHQIRVHFSSIHHQLVGDLQYGVPGINKVFVHQFGLVRQFLHAYKLKFTHPITKKTVDLEIDLPQDLQRVVDSLDVES